MTRAVLLAGAMVWGIGSLVAAAVAAIGVETLERLLPSLAIDTEALRGAIVALALGLGLGSAAHAAVLLGLRRGRRRAWTAGILLAGMLAATFVALGASAFTSAIAAPASAVVLTAAGVAASLAALGYGVVAAGLVGEKRSGTVI